MPRHWLTFEQFASECRRVMRSFPQEFRPGLELVAVDVQDEPSADDLSTLDPPWDPRGDEDLLGIFIGVPLTERSPDAWMKNQIKIFRGPIERACASRSEVRRTIRETILHEVAHHFGYTEEQLEEFERRCAERL